MIEFSQVHFWALVIVTDPVYAVNLAPVPVTPLLFTDHKTGQTTPSSPVHRDSETVGMMALQDIFHHKCFKGLEMHKIWSWIFSSSIKRSNPVLFCLYHQ